MIASFRSTAACNISSALKSSTDFPSVKRRSAPAASLMSCSLFLASVVIDESAVAVDLVAQHGIAEHGVRQQIHGPGKNLLQRLSQPEKAVGHARMQRR